MQTIDLARASASAEVLRLKRLIRRQAMRAVFGAVAAVFVIGALILLHVVAFAAMAPYLGPIADSAVLLGADLVVAVIFGVLALRDTPDAVEAEALLLRNQSLAAMRESVMIGTLIGPVGALAGRMFGRKRGAGLTMAALAATLLGRKRR